MRLWTCTLWFELKKQHKITNKQSNLLNLTVSCEKGVAKSEVKDKTKQSKTLMETIIVIIVIAKTNIGNNSAWGNVEKKQSKQ